MAKNQPPKGKVKGGARFPRHNLKSCFGWAQKLVSKTHLGPQPKDVILAGVVETKGPNGEVKISALKQFGLLEGDSSAYTASDLAKKLVNAPENERTPLLRNCALEPVIFRGVFDTFQGDTTPFAKVRQRFTDLNVHPDNADQCVEVYGSSLEFAGLASLNGDQISHVSASEVAASPDPAHQVQSDAVVEPQEDQPPKAESGASSIQRRTGNAVIQVNVTVDSSLDTDKLEKQLQLLKKYGAL